MSYEAVDIKDRVAVGDDCFQLVKLSDGRYRLVPAPDSISEVGTNVDRALLYPMSLELERLSESIPETSPSDAGKAIIVTEDGSYALGDAGSKDAVLYTEQTLTTEQKAQARANIEVSEAAVLYTEQTLTEEQKAQARANIGAGDTEIAAENVTAGTFAGDVKAPDTTDMATPILRNSVITSTDPGAGASVSYPAGTEICVYE